MEHKLATVLVERGLLPTGTEVHAQHKVAGLGSVNSVTVRDDFSIVSTNVKNGKVTLVLANLFNGAQSTVNATAIITIDGMDPVRFASVYEITAEGEKAVVGARRGRKPKNRQQVIEDLEDEDENEDEISDFL